MIKINLSPVFTGNKLTASVTGTTITTNGTAYNLSELPDGATAQHPVLGDVSRNGDKYELTLTLTHGFNASESVRFPEPVEVTGDWTLEYEYDIIENVEVSDELAE